MTLLEKILTELESAPEPLLSQVLDFIQTNKAVTVPISNLEISPRTPGLHQGEIWMSEDFNEPLPDEFWLGNSV